MHEDELLTILEVCKILKLTKQTIRRKLISGQLIGKKMGKAWRIKKSDLNDYIEKSDEII